MATLRLTAIGVTAAALFSFAAMVPSVAGQMAPPASKHHIYSDMADASTDIAAALKRAKVEKKRVILDFGGDWCGDCQVLYIYLQQSPNKELLEKNFILVSVNIGRFDKNVDIAAKYDVPIKKGVPALAVLDANGKLVYSQKNKEFESMREMNVQSVTEFLNKWKKA